MTDKTSTAPLATLDTWLKSRRRSVLLAVVLVASIVRLIAFVELHESPVMESYSYEQMDMRFFNEWAVKIAKVDAVGSEPVHPLHMWHRLIAESEFVAHPDLIEGKAPSELSPEEAASSTKKLWDEWYLGTRFHQEPLYAYMIAAIYTICGSPDARFVYAVQMLGGIVTILLLFLVSRRMFGDLVAVLTAILAMWWGPLIHYEVTLLRTSLITMMGVLLLFCGQVAKNRRDSSGSLGLLGSFGFGCVIGVATTLKSTFLVFAIGMVVAIFWPQRKQLSTVMKQVAWIVVGALLVLLPVFIRNYYVGAPLFSLTSVGAVTFAGANVPGSTPVLGWYPYKTTVEIAKIMHDHHGSLLSVVGATLASHESLFGYLGLLWQKFALIFHWYELPNNTNYYYSCIHSVVLTIGRHFVDALWVLPAAVIGSVIAVAQRRPVGTWIWYFICSIGPMVVFYTLSRFRVPMMMAMMPFAAFAVVQIVQWFMARHSRLATRYAVALGLLVLLMSRDLPKDRAVVAAGCYGMSIKDYYLPRINEARTRRDFKAAVEVFESLFATEPDYLRQIGPDRPIANRGEAAMVGSGFTWIYRFYGQCLREAGDPVRAQYVDDLVKRFKIALDEFAAKERAKAQQQRGK
jgi:4-amino-4-deoxy-L-arabinose transferase-like glycosyltransferase